MSKDYYQILGVDKSASADDIKRAYRKQALKYHPDRGGDQQKFKEVNEAYQVLSNPQKKSQFDQFGQTFEGMGAGGGAGAGGYQSYGFGGQQGQGFEDIFSSGFGFGGGLGDIFENFFGSTFSQVNVELQISLTQAILGDKVRFKTQVSEVEMEIPAGTQDGQSFRIPGKGASYRRGRGDLIVTIRVKIPKRVSQEERELYEKLRNLEQKKGWRFWKK